MTKRNAKKVILYPILAFFTLYLGTIFTIDYLKYRSVMAKIYNIKLGCSNSIDEQLSKKYIDAMRKKEFDLLRSCFIT